MDLSSFVTYDKKESLFLSIAKSNQKIVENTHSKPQETLEFKMTKQKESFSFDVSLLLTEKWMMGVTSLEVYNTVYNITEKNNKLEILLTKQKLEEHRVDTELVPKIKDLYETSDDKIIEKTNTLITNSYIKKKKKLTRKDFNQLKELIEVFNYPDQQIRIPDFEIEHDSFGIQLTPGAYELVDINASVKQIITDTKTALQSALPYSDFKFNIIPDTISMKSVLTTSNPIHFNSELNKVLGFIQRDYLSGTHTSEKPVMITTTDKVHLKCDCVDGSIVNGIREQILFSFNLNAPPGYKTIKEPTTVLYKLINKTRLDTIQFFLEDSNHNPVDFNGETLNFTIQIIKI